MKIIGKTVLATVLAATTLGAATPAMADGWDRGGWHGGRHHDNDAGVAIGAGVIGLALGAAIASSANDRHRDRGYYYDRSGYYGRPYYRDYYYRPQRYDYDRYYDRGYSYRHCWSEQIWDDYRGSWSRIERCR